MLVLRALSGTHSEIMNLSDSDDTQVMIDSLEGGTGVKDIGHAGTAMRFLAAYFATRPGRTVLTGSDRMKERPVGPLVEALRDLGAGITYMGKEGCAPLEISGGLQNGGRIRVDGGISSQFISALMMIGPVLQGGLIVELTGDVVSSTYIRMTQALMKAGGIHVQFEGNVVKVEEGRYRFRPFRVESDWSGASYWYQVAALLPGSKISLPYLEQESLQGDAVLADLFRPLGVESRFVDGMVILERATHNPPDNYNADFKGCPDLVQTCASTLCAMGIPFRFTGTRTLRVKETDRITALQNELGKLGFTLRSDAGGDWISWDGKRSTGTDQPVISTYHDHRMALAFAPLAITFGPITIEDPMVVTKSYPGYWNDLKKTGFTVAELA